MSKRIAIEFSSSTSDVIRGIKLANDGASRVLLVHSLGADLDEFGSFPEKLHARGYEPIAIDLIGHGISDGLSNLPRIREDLLCLIKQLVGDGDSIGLVMSGQLSTIGAHIGVADKVVAQIFVNPELDETFMNQEDRAQSIRLIIHGDDPNIAATKTKKFFSYLLGEKMMVSSLSAHLGLLQLSDLSQIQNHVELFLHRYLSQKPETRPVKPTSERAL